jgi:hypothetical protein
MRVVGGVGGLVGELHRDPEAEAVLGADLAHHLERLDPRDGGQPFRRGVEISLLRRRRSVVQIEGDRVS